MLYVLDTNSIRVRGNFYPDRFPTLWDELAALVSAGRLESVREVAKEIDRQDIRDHVEEWLGEHTGFFAPPSAEELEKVAEILAVPHFQQLIGAKQRLRGLPVADPFVIAHAMIHDACVVTEEKFKENAAKVPNVCAHFGVDCTDLEGLMTREGWRF